MITSTDLVLWRVGSRQRLSRVLVIDVLDLQEDIFIFVFRKHLEHCSRGKSNGGKDQPPSLPPYVNHFEHRSRGGSNNVTDEPAPACSYSWLLPAAPVLLLAVPGCSWLAPGCCWAALGCSWAGLGCPRSGSNNIQERYQKGFQN